MVSKFEMMIICEIEKRNKRKIPYVSKMEKLIQKEIENRKKRQETIIYFAEKYTK